MSQWKILVSAVTLSIVCAGTATAHCEIPCGIYDDERVISELHQHITTIEKSMLEIEELSGEESKNYNQLVRWVNNKEEHASKIQDVVQRYFLTQRIKPVKASNEAAYEKYVREVTLLHSLLVHAMKAKQTTDLTHAKALHKNLGLFEESYLQAKS